MTNVYVGNVGRDVTKEALQEAFAAFGAVDRVSIVADRVTGEPRGFAFIEMSNDAEAQAAIASLNGKELGGRALTVNIARPKAEGGGGRPGGDRRR
jgi:RNA recognition motif-containing protein